MRRDRGLRRGRQLRRRDARRPLDRRARRVREHPRARHLRAARGRAQARGPLRPGLHRRGLRLDRGGARSPRPRRCAALGPYSATKAGADLLVASYRHTFGTETLICRGSNNYGPYQYPEKLIPLMVLNALHGDKLPVYGDGMQVRNWIYVEDFARGIGFALDHGVPGEVYNVGGPDECPNLEVVNRIVELTGGRRGADRVRHRPPRPRPPLLAELGQDPRARLGAAASASPRASSAPSPGTARTAGGGSRSAPATTAPTTSASTAARWASRAQAGDPPVLADLLQAQGRGLVVVLDDGGGGRAADRDVLDREVVVVGVGERVGDLRLAIRAGALQAGRELLGQQLRRRSWPRSCAPRPRRDRRSRAATSCSVPWKLPRGRARAGAPGDGEGDHERDEGDGEA